MITINTKIKERMTKGLRKFQPVLRKALAADLNESDTVTIITDMLCELFGYDKYENITSEFAIKKTYCDIAVKLQDRLLFLIECKAIGLDLKDDYIRQATNYAANSGIQWVVLTNGISWKVFHLSFGTAVEKELVYEFNVTELSAKKQGDLELLYYLSIEAFSKTSKATLDSFRAEKQILNRFIIGRVILSDAGVDSIRKCVRRLYPELKVSNEQLVEIIGSECFRREIIEGDYADDARKAVAKQERKISKAKTKKEVVAE